MNVLLIEDDRKLSEALTHILEENHYIVDSVYNGVDGLYYASNHSYSAIILDVMMPKMNGYEVIRHFRKQKKTTPVLMLTAKSEVIDRVKGLDCGADDYLTKPFATDELLARLRALTRRSRDIIIDEITYGDLLLHINNLVLESESKSVNLSNKEFLLMEILMTNPGNILSKDHLISKIWSDTSEATGNNVEAYVSFLRKKLIYLDSSVSIKSIRLVGYKLEADQ